MPERAQAEVLGYALLFSVIVLTLLIVTSSGQAGLTELRDDKQTANVEKGFVSFARNVDDLSRGDAPSRATELDLAGGRLSLGRPVTVTVEARNSTGTVFQRSRTLEPVVYTAPDGTRLVYATGAVMLRGERGGTAVLRRPRLALSSSRTVVPLANTSLDRRQLRALASAVDRESRVLVRTERRHRRVLAATDATVDVTITVDSPRAAAWERLLDAEVDPASDDCSVSGGTVSCTYRTDSAAVVATRVAVSLE